jgi:ribonuclease HI
VTENNLLIITDGACLGNPGPGGWCAILRYGSHEKVLSGGAPLTTNNQMEMTAAIEALQALKRPCLVRLRTDSLYLRDGISGWIARWQRNGWKTTKGEPVKNQDLWKALHRLVQTYEVQWEWVEGHAGDPDNEKANRIAQSEARKWAKPRAQG